MSLRGCCAAIKYIFLIVNLLFWLAGLAVLAFSIWLLVAASTYLNVTQDASNYYTGTYVLLIAGAVMAIVGFLGCCGAFRESQCMLATFFAFVLVILVAQVAAGVWAYVHRDSLENTLRTSVKTTMQHDYGIGKDTVKTEALDKVQSELKCCGAEEGPADWYDTDFSRGEREKRRANLTIESRDIQYVVPVSCCVDQNTAGCNAAREHIVGEVDPLYKGRALHREGCTKKLLELLHKYMSYVIGIGIGIGVLELLGLIFSMVLCCAIRSMDQYKA